MNIYQVLPYKIEKGTNKSSKELIIAGTDF